MFSNKICQIIKQLNLSLRIQGLTSLTVEASSIRLLWNINNVVGYNKSFRYFGPSTAFYFFLKLVIVKEMQLCELTWKGFLGIIFI